QSFDLRSWIDSLRGTNHHGPRPRIQPKRGVELGERGIVRQDPLFEAAEPTAASRGAHATVGGTARLEALDQSLVREVRPMAGGSSLEVAHAVGPRGAMIRPTAILGGAAMRSFCDGSADLPASLADLRSWSRPGRELARFFQAAILVEL